MGDPMKKKGNSEAPSISTLLHADYVTQQQRDEDQQKESSSSQQSQQQSQVSQGNSKGTSGDTSISSLVPLVANHPPDNKEMFQMINRQRWPMPNFGVSPLMGPNMSHVQFPFPNGVPILPNSRAIPKARSKKRKENESSDKPEDSCSKRMQCWNCAPDCPNQNQGAALHHVAGMCGRCHQKWQKHPKERWVISKCVSKCRCFRCDASRAESDNQKDPAEGLIQFQTILDETNAGQGSTMLHLAAKRLIADCQKEVVSDMSSLMTLSVLVGDTNVKPSADESSWESFVLLSNLGGERPIGPVKAQAPSPLLPSNITEKSFMSLFDIASIPFFLACCIRVNMSGGAPHETRMLLNLKQTSETRKVMVKYNSNSDFQVFVSPASTGVPTSTTELLSASVPLNTWAT